MIIIGTENFNSVFIKTGKYIYILFRKCLQRQYYSLMWDRYRICVETLSLTAKVTIFTLKLYSATKLEAH